MELFDTLDIVFLEVEEDEYSKQSFIQRCEARPPNGYWTNSDTKCNKEGTLKLPSTITLVD